MSVFLNFFVTLPSEDPLFLEAMVSGELGGDRDADEVDDVEDVEGVDGDGVDGGLGVWKSSLDVDEVVVDEDVVEELMSD